MSHPHPSDHPHPLATHPPSASGPPPGPPRPPGVLSFLPSPLVTPAPIKFLSNMIHNVFGQTLHAFVELGIADVLDTQQPLTASHIAKKKGWNAKRLYRLFDHIQHSGIILRHNATQQQTGGDTNEWDTDGWTLTEDGSFLRQDHPSQLCCVVLFTSSSMVRSAMDYIGPVISDPTDDGQGEGTAGWMNGVDRLIVKNGGKQTDFFTWIKLPENKSSLILYEKAMQALSSMDGAVFIGLYAQQLKESVSIVDIGGGTGSLVKQVVRANPQIKGILADLPEVIELAKKEGLDNITSVVTDFFSIDSLTNLFKEAHSVDKPWIIVMKNVLHDWADSYVLTILGNIHTAIDNIPHAKDHVHLAIYEHNIVPHNHPAASHINWMTTAVDITMMMVHGAQQRTEQQWNKLFKQTGWKTNGFLVGQSPSSIIEAIIA